MILYKAEFFKGNEFKDSFLITEEEYEEIVAYIRSRQPF
jgi:hypothetical protein